MLIVGVFCESSLVNRFLIGVNNLAWITVSWDLSKRYISVSNVKEILISMLRNRNIPHIDIHCKYIIINMYECVYRYIYLYCIGIWLYILIFYQYSFKGFFTMSDLIFLSLVLINLYTCDLSCSRWGNRSMLCFRRYWQIFVCAWAFLFLRSRFSEKEEQLIFCLLSGPIHRTIDLWK